MDTTIMLGSLKFSPRVTIDHHGPSIHYGHYTASINCWKKKPFYCNDSKIAEFEIIDSKNSSTAYVSYTLWIDWLMSFGLEQEGGSWITPMALAHHDPLHPINSRSRNKRRNLWVGRCVSSWWPLFPSRNSVLIYIYMYVCILISLYELWL